MVIIFLYFLELFIRPQDWVSFFLGWPTHWLIVLPGFIYALFRQSNRFERFILPQNGLIIGFLLIIFISTSINVGAGEGWSQFNLNANRALIFFFIILLIDSESRIKWTIIFYLFYVLLLSIHSFQQVSTGVGWANVSIDPHYEELRTRWVGVWDGSNGFGVLFAVGIPLALELLLNKGSFFLRVYGLICVIMFFPSLFYTSSRGDILALGLGLVVYSIFRFKMRYAIIIGTLGIIVFFAFSPSRMDRLDSQESSAHERVYTWEQGMGMLRRNPVFGVGKGQFSYYNELGMIAHNNYVSMSAELGFPGYFLWLAIIYFCGKGMIIANKRLIDERGRNSQNIPRALIASIATLLGATFFIVLEHDFFYLMFGLAAASYLIFVREEYEDEIFNFSIRDAGIVFFGAIAIILLIRLIAIYRII
jgi:O-antigen ligase